MSVSEMPQNASKMTQSTTVKSGVTQLKPLKHHFEQKTYLQLTADRTMIRGQLTTTDPAKLAKHFSRLIMGRTVINFDECIIFINL